MKTATDTCVTTSLSVHHTRYVPFISSSPGWNQQSVRLHSTHQVCSRSVRETSLTGMHGEKSKPDNTQNKNLRCTYRTPLYHHLKTLTLSYVFPAERMACYVLFVCNLRCTNTKIDDPTSYTNQCAVPGISCNTTGGNKGIHILRGTPPPP